MGVLDHGNGCRGRNICVIPEPLDAIAYSLLCSQLVEVHSFGPNAKSFMHQNYWIALECEPCAGKQEGFNQVVSLPFKACGHVLPSLKGWLVILEWLQQQEVGAWILLHEEWQPLQKHLAQPLYNMCKGFSSTVLH